jgi:hypothetical protein
MSVRAKFKCWSIQHTYSHSPDASAAQVTLTPVYGDSEENKTWSQHTPSGKIEMLITNPSAIASFELGKDYYVDFTPAA